MKKARDKTLGQWWRDMLRIDLPLISDWLEKESIYLKNNIKRNSTILDVGCGWGRDIKMIAKTAKKVVGIDNDPRMIREAKRNLSKFKNIKLFLEDVKKMHFKDNSFDYVICLGNTFGNLGKGKYKALEEMKRVVKKKGKIIISVYSEKALPIRIEGYIKAGLKIKKITRDGTVYTENGLVFEQFSKEKLRKIFKKAKLKVKVFELSPISYICEVKKK